VVTAIGSEERPVTTLYREKIVEMEVTGIHDIMGASCLLLALPSLTCAVLLCAGDLAKGARIPLALVCGAFMFYTSLGSFLGDYYCAGENKPVPCEATGVHAWQKHDIVNKIDNVNAHIVGISMGALTVYQCFYASTGRWIHFASSGLMCTALAIKAYATTYFNKAGLCNDGTPEDADNFWFACFWHSIWHVVGCLPPSICIYGLLKQGF